jgi:hypothetical protein
MPVSPAFQLLILPQRQQGWQQNSLTSIIFVFWCLGGEIMLRQNV